MRILFVTSNISWPPRIGGEIRKWNVLQGLIACGQTDALVFCKHGTQMDRESYEGCNRLYPVDDRHIHMSSRDRQRYESTFGRGQLTLSSTLPYEYLGEDLKGLRQKLAREVRFSDYDLVWFATARAAVPVGKITAGATVLDGDDFSYVREWHLLKSTSFYGAKLWNFLDVLKLWWWESSFPRQYTHVVRCSIEDVKKHPSANVTVIPNGTLVKASIERAPQRRAVFVGDLSYAPNEQGLVWFLKHIWPLIRQNVRDAEFHIIGRKASEAIMNSHGKDGVVVHGFVDSLDDLFREASLSVVPLTAGGGTRLKILDSLGLGVPVVSTTIGAFGIDAGEEQGVFRADLPERFAEQCIQLLLNPSFGDERAAAGRKLVVSKYDWKIIQQQVSDLALKISAKTAAIAPASTL